MHAALFKSVTSAIDMPSQLMHIDVHVQHLKKDACVPISCLTECQTHICLLRKLVESLMRFIAMSRCRTMWPLLHRALFEVQNICCHNVLMRIPCKANLIRPDSQTRGVMQLSLPLAHHKILGLSHSSSSTLYKRSSCWTRSWFIVLLEGATCVSNGV